MEAPEGFWIEQSTDRLSIRFKRDLNESRVVLLLAAVVFPVLMIAAFAYSYWFGSGIALNQLLLVGVFLLIISYYAASKFFNRIKIIVNQDVIKVFTRPLPTFSYRRIDCKGLKKIEIGQSYDPVYAAGAATGQVTEEFFVYAKFSEDEQSWQEVIRFSKYESANAEFIAQRIQDFLFHTKINTNATD